ncbi:YcjF family protein [Vibrio maerlii]|uniref:YcjF family protein n=1 Tax=Vibrio maerlii TaxID=2231648 RepID=UPI000E3DD22B|nr:TIGR01620 family protein [Vibrio maerlii]
MSPEKFDHQQAFKKQQVFSQQAPASESADSDEKLKVEVEQSVLSQSNERLFESQQTFAPTVFEKNEEEVVNEVEENLEKVIRPSYKSKGLMAMLTVFVGLVGWQAIDSVITAIQAADWLSLSWAGFFAALASFGLSGLIKELWQLRHLRNHFDVQKQGEELLALDSFGKAKPFCEALAQQSAIAGKSPSYDRWSNSVVSTHTDAEVMDLYDALVVTELDKKAQKIVTKMSGESALLVAASPLAIADMLLVAWRSFKMLDELAKVYGVQLGYWSRLKLFKFTLINMALAGASEIIADASIELLSMDMAGKVSTRAAQGIGVGILTARLGIKAMSLLRPTPWNKERKVKLSDLRKGIITQVKRLAP